MYGKKLMSLSYSNINNFRNKIPFSKILLEFEIL